MRGSKGGRTGRAPPPLFVGRNIFNTYHFCTGLEVRRYTPVSHTGTSLVGLKAYRHFFLGESHTGMAVCRRQFSGCKISLLIGKIIIIMRKCRIQGVVECRPYVTEDCG